MKYEQKGFNANSIVKFRKTDRVKEIDNRILKVNRHCEQINGPPNEELVRIRGMSLKNIHITRCLSSFDANG